MGLRFPLLALLGCLTLYGATAFSASAPTDNSNVSFPASWQVSGKTEATDAQVPERLNLSFDALASGSNTYAAPPWNVATVTKAEYAPRGRKYISNEADDVGWISGSFGVDAHLMYVQLDFNYDEPIEFDRVYLFDCPARNTPEFRPAYVLERRLGDTWEPIFIPRTFDEANSPKIEFSELLQANALRVRFIEPGVSGSYWGLGRFWVFGPKKPHKNYKGGVLEVTAPGLTRTENSIIFEENAPTVLMLTYTADKRNSARPATLEWQLTSYYGDVLKSGSAIVDIEEAATLVLDLGNNPPGAYFLKSTLTSDNAVLLRNQELFGVKGTPAAPPERLYQHAKLQPPQFEIAGAIGQFDGVGVRKSHTMVEAFRDIDANTIQVEMFWRDLEPLPGVYNFSGMDEIMDYVLSLDKYAGITIYLGDDQSPTWLTNPDYATRDQYNKPAWGRNDWKLNFYTHASVHFPPFLEHLSKLWELTAARYTPTGRILRFDPRPPLLEVFYFDDYVNELWNRSETDAVWDYSVWSKQAFGEYMTQVRGFTLEQLNARYGMNWQTLSDVTLPEPRPLAERANDLREHWRDFMEFKHQYTPQKYFSALVRAIQKSAPETPIFIDDTEGEEMEKLRQAGKLVSGNFSIEFGLQLLGVNHPEFQKLCCYEWGAPAPPYYHFNAGLFYILPLLKGNSLRWVAGPCIGPEKFNRPEMYKSWAGLRKIAPKMEILTQYQTPQPSEIAISGDLNVAHSEFETAKPIRERRNCGEFDRWILGNWGGVSGMLKTANFLSGLPFYDWLINYERDHSRWKLIIDGGNVECPLAQQQQVLDFVRNGGKALIWSNSFQRSDKEVTHLLRDELHIVYHDAAPDATDHELKIQLPGEQETFTGSVYQIYDLTLPESAQAIGWIADKAAAWRIPYGQGEVIFVNALPKMPRPDSWTPFMDALARYAGVKRATKVEQDATWDNYTNLLSYSLKHDDKESYILAVYNAAPMIVKGTVTYLDLLPEQGRDQAQVSLFHSTEDGSKLLNYEISESGDISMQIEIMPLDMLLLEVTVEQ